MDTEIPRSGMAESTMLFYQNLKASEPRSKGKLKRIMFQWTRKHEAFISAPKTGQLSLLLTCLQSAVAILSKGTNRGHIFLGNQWFTS